MAIHDRNLIKRADIKRFQVWLDANDQAWRPGKGDYQMMQVKIGKGWGAICTDAAGVITTPPGLAPLIKLFKQGGAVKKTAAPAAKLDTFLDDLRDDFAMSAMQGRCHLEYSAWADLAADAYNIADAMLAERAKRVKA